MEKSHYMARTGYFKHTRHGGGKNRANSLLELHQWTYRKLFHRAQLKDKLKSSELVRAIQRTRKQKRRIAWNESSAKERHDLWRHSRVRVGRTWA